MIFELHMFLLALKTIRRQQYLPVTLQDLKNNNINTEEEFWNYMESILVVYDNFTILNSSRRKDIRFKIFNTQSLAECEQCFTQKFQKENCDDFYAGYNKIVSPATYFDFANYFDIF